MSKLTDIRAAVENYPDDFGDYFHEFCDLLAIAEAASEVVHHEVKTVGLNYDGLIKWDKLEAALAKLGE